jgi:hypothetical protein
MRNFSMLVCLLACAATAAAPAEINREALAGIPAINGHPLLYVVRRQYRPDHHNTATFFPAAQYEYNDGQFTPGAALKVVDSKVGNTSVVLQTTDGVIRDPDVDFDGKRILFSMRRNRSDSYHLYEVNSDGTGLRQLTFMSDVDDLDPLYLPDGSIAFSSTREPKYCMCNRHIMANLFRMDADGGNIHQIGKSTLFEGHGALTPDGRIIYDRWEYVDRNFGDAQSLWTVNPDGTNPAVYWGNNTAAPGAVLDPRIIPGTDRVVCVFGSCHDRPWGALAIVDRQLGMDGREPVVSIWPAEATNLISRTGWEIFDAFTSIRLKYEDPFPLNESQILCSRMTGQGEEMGIYLLDLAGGETQLVSEAPGCFDPMPLAPRALPAPVPTRREYTAGPGVYYVENVYRGTHMAGVKPGSIKWLRVVESPEKRFWTTSAWNGQGQEAPAMNWHDFNNKRILGTVPVEPDGSVYFEVPADRFVYFQLLDGAGMMVQSMRSGVVAQSGEQAGCIGCHEERRHAPAVSTKPLLALQRAPAKLEGWHGLAREFNYLAEVQPVLDRNCVSCHDYGTPAGDKLNLAGDRDVVFNTSYNELWRKKLIRVVGAGPAETQPAFSWGSHASRLVAFLRETPRCGARLLPEDWDRIVTWIDLNAPYYPSYASAYPANLAGRSPVSDSQLQRLEQLTGTNIRGSAGHGSNSGPQISFDRPEVSTCLAKLSKNSPEYLEAVAIIRTGQQSLSAKPEADKAGFQPAERDQWRDAKYLARQSIEHANRQAIQSGKKRFDSGHDQPR